MNHRDIIVVGASAGGIEALRQLVACFPDDLAASVFITVHFPENATSVLPRILTRAGPLLAVHPSDGETIVHGRVYVAPPDFHLLLEPDRIRLVRGPRENGHRPAIDPMFRSAAVAFGSRVIGVVLTGNLDDGTSGLATIKRNGGTAVVQDPDDALFPSMPRSALDHVRVDWVGPIRSMASVLVDLVAEPLHAPPPSPTPDDVMEKNFSAADLDTIESPERHPGKPSPFGCPDCGGVLWEIAEGEFVRYRCRVGHAWSTDGLLSKQSDVSDDALWTALRALEESASLSRKIAARHEAGGAPALANRFTRQADLTEQRAKVIRDSLLQSRGLQNNPDPEETHGAGQSALETES
jgi:two-component system, chemotaxis family, protein-glutamate methylesterase/glutaminase